MDKRILLFFIIGLMLSSAVAAAEPLLVLNYAVCKNDSVMINSIKYADGTVKLYQVAGDEYKININDKNNKPIATLGIPVSFYVFSEPPKETDCSSGYQRLPWENETKYINFYHKNNLIKNIDIAEYILPNAAAVCNRNNICEPEKGENIINCPDDCSFSNNADNSWIMTLSALIAISATAAIILYFRRKKEFKPSVAFEE